MTKKERAIQILEQRAFCGECVVENYTCAECDEAFDVAIKLLKQEPCEDAISRQAVLDLAKKGVLISNGNYESVCKAINELPSVTPQPKTGHWIDPQQDDGMSDPIYYQVRCSNCGFDFDPQTFYQELKQYGADSFCPNCGAKMVEPQESEE